MSRHSRWMVALWAVCLLVAAGGHLPGGDRPAASGAATPTTVGMVSAAADPAVLPARVADEVRSTTHNAPLRGLLLAALVGSAVALAPTLRRRASAEGSDHRPLQARRHAIALRAPPLQLA